MTYVKRGTTSFRIQSISIKREGVNKVAIEQLSKNGKTWQTRRKYVRYNKSLLRFGSYSNSRFG